MPPRELTLDLPGLRLAAREWGEAGQPRVLALHGWLDNAASFDRLAPLLPGFHVVAVDLAGHGRSGHRPPGAAYHLVDAAADVLAVADTLDWARFSLLGHSLGAIIASLVPAVAPDRVERLVLLEGFGPWVQSPEDTPRHLAEALAQEARWAGTPQRAFPSLDAAVLARVVGSDLDNGHARLLVERAVEAAAGGVRFRHDQRLRAHARLRMTEDQVRAFLSAIRCPVLAVRAHPGWEFDEEEVGARLAMIPDVRRLDVDGGHHVHLSHPELVAPAIRSFLLGPAQAPPATR